MNVEHMKKLERLLFIMQLFQEPGRRRWQIKEIAAQLEINEDTVGKYLRDLELSGLLPITKEGHYWFLPEGAMIPQISLSLSYPEAVGLYLAGRLLAQTQDEPNWHVSMALKKLIEALPPSLQAQQEMLRELLLIGGDEQQPDTSGTFQALACGWVHQRRVQLYYVPPHGRGFECFFDPYLLEPSAIGRTIYAIGYSSAGKGPRTYKLERIRSAKLTEETFEVQPDFNGPEKLKQAWTVMYGDEEPVRVHLRFNAEATRRVRETRWHPSQEITLTRDGCEWSALIGDTLEIEPWIRGWGGDCVVLAPQALRERIIYHARRTMVNYELVGPSSHDPKKFDRNLFKKQEE